MQINKCLYKSKDTCVLTYLDDPCFFTPQRHLCAFACTCVSKTHRYGLMCISHMSVLGKDTSVQSHAQNPSAFARQWHLGPLHGSVHMLLYPAKTHGYIPMYWTHVSLRGRLCRKYQPSSSRAYLPFCFLLSSFLARLHGELHENNFYKKKCPIRARPLLQIWRFRF